MDGDRMVIAEFLQKLHADGMGIVLVTHNPELADRTTRRLHMRDGHLVDAAS